MDRRAPVTQTIILAAGMGSRLVGPSGVVPKPLMTIAGLSLIEHALAHAHASGAVEAIVVIGHEGDRVRGAVEALHLPLAVRFVTSPDPSLPNGESLLAAEPLAAPAFFLQMVDHLFADAALPRLIRTPLESSEGGRVLVDRAPFNLDLEDATKVRLDGVRVRAIGKGLDPWDAIDAGCFVLTHEVFDALRSAPASEPRTVSSGMRQLAARDRLTSMDVNGIEWMDVDTPSDRVAAERFIAALTNP
jgi:MurNAc alpha-1-phosphate uridylyltransferase